MLANQLAHFRFISDKNFARSIFIETETQVCSSLMCKMRISNHKINQAHVSFLKGMNFANQGESVDQIRNREQKYHHRQDLQQTIEELMNAGLDSAFEEQESERPLPEYFDQEVNAVFREALDPKLKSRDFAISKKDTVKDVIR
jgi:hypothetical protein